MPRRGCQTDWGIAVNIRSIVDRLLPHTCLLCGAASGPQRLCAGCDADLPRHAMAQCPVCATPTPRGEVCGHCLKRPPAFDHSLAAFTYAYPLDRLIPALKYGTRLAIVPVLGDALAAAAAERTVDAVVPMPMHAARLYTRGFNVASEIARVVARRRRIALDTHTCRRIRDTPPQVSLAYAERRRNMRGAFACGPGLAGRRIALIDDVMTTGTSLDALARCLKDAKAAWVECWVVARTLPPGER